MIKIYFDNVLIDEDAYAELTNDYKLFTDNFYLGSTASNTFKITIAKTEVSSHPSEVKITDDTNTYHLIVDKVTEEKNFYVYDLVDKLVLFNFNYNAKTLIDTRAEDELTTTLSDILADMCTQAGVTLDSTLTLINDIEVDWYDNTILARDYLSYIAELQGGFARILDDGKLTIAGHKITSQATLQIDNCEDFILGEKKTISRVVYDNGIVKYEYGDETANTLYINPNNVYITDTTVVSNIYDEVVGLEFYLVETGKCRLDPSVRAGDIITFTDGTNSYLTIAGYSASFGGGYWLGNYSLNVASKQQEETQVIGLNTELKSIKTIIDRTNATVEIVTEQVQENASNITTTQQDVSGLNIKVEENEQDIEKKTTELGIRIDGINLNFVNSGNNILIGTQFYDMQGWGIGLNRNYVEQPTPPDNPIDWMYWYCSQDYGEYKNGTIYRYETDKWVAYPSLTRKDLDNQITYIKNFDVLDNEETRKTALSERYGRLYTTGKQGEEGLIGEPGNYFLDNTSLIAHNIERLNIEQEYMTFSFKIKNEIEYGQGGIFVDLYNKEATTASEILSSILLENYTWFYKNSRSGLYTIKTPILNEGNVIYGESGDTPPEDTTKKWLYTEDYFMGMLLTYENENWIPDTSKYIFNDGTYDYVYINGVYVNFPIDSRESTHTITGGGLLEQYVTVVDEDEPDYIDYSTMWANPVTDEIKIPIFENEEFKSWETIDVTYTQAVDNYELAPEIFEGPCVFPKGNLIFYDMKLEYGDYTKWTPSQDEFYGRNFAMTDKGFYIKRADNIMFIDEDEIKATYKNIPIFSLDGQEVFGKIIKTEKTDITGLITKKIKVGTKDIYIRYKEE